MEFQEPFPVGVFLLLGTVSLVVGIFALGSPERIQKLLTPSGELWARGLLKRFHDVYASPFGKRVVIAMGVAGVVMGVVLYALVVLYWRSKR